MILTRVRPGPAEVLDLEADGSRATLLDWYRPPRPDWLRLNLVASVNGGVVGADGTSNPLSSPVDRRVLGVIRELADVVLVGAASVRVEGYVVPRRAPLAIVTGSGDLGGHRLDPADVARVTVLGPAQVAERVDAQLPGVRFLPVPDAAAAIPALRATGATSLVAEGGPTLAGALVAAGLVDDLCLTTSPTLTADTRGILAGVVPETPLELHHLAVGDDGAVFAQWRVSGR